MNGFFSRSTSLIFPSSVPFPQLRGICLWFRSSQSLRLKPCVSRLVFQPHFGAEILTVLVSLETRGSDAVSGKLLVSLLSVARNADGTDDFSVLVTDQPAAALGKNLVV